ncbi:MAG: hypothetical protein JWM35_2371 [Verrucomicrobia bacterium]|nr:hypothetical protein [Verrucomicrobiota bacterium]
MRFRSLTAWLLLIWPVLAHSAEGGVAASPSAFVRAQAGSAVHWHAWNDATLAEARVANRSVYVFVGSPLNGLTRATISQTFASGKIVAWLNENFFCMFVDADAQPDLAALAQHYIRSVKQLQGSPVHLWLTPELQPFDGANYLPPSEEWGKPGFLKTARTALENWTGNPARARALAKEAIDLMRVPPLGAGPKIDLAAKLGAAASAWVATLDPVNGGFGSVPKEPEPELIRFLLARGAAGRVAALNAARALVRGAAHDPVDGGFYRRTIDEAWKEPYYQKTLADQARIAMALFDAADEGKDDTLRAAAIDALDFVLAKLRYPDGSFAAALDGNLDENSPPTKRPAFVPVGIAPAGAQSLLVVALQRSGETRLAAIAAQLAAKLPEPRTAADYAAAALAFRSLKDNERADHLLARGNEIFFDPAVGKYMASPAQLPSGIALRVPATGDIPSPETLALLARTDAGTAALLRLALLAEVEYDEQPPGEVLLGLATAP